MNNKRKILIIVLLTIFISILLWVVSITTAPKIEVRCINYKITPPDIRWRDAKTSNLMQVEFIFEFSNKYDKDMPLFGVYSTKMESFAKAIQGVNYEYHQYLPTNRIKRYSVFYLIELFCRI